jgi:flavin reductase (DIM6/NTAB) family NADH-FMN oxidoreductase RutF
MMDELFKTVPVKDLNDNLFKIIDNDWMLITAGRMESFNTMTANWGTMGILWHKPVAICFIRPTRHTFQFAEKSGLFTLSFFEEEYRNILDFCGTHSGRDIDKVKQTGLKPVFTSQGGIAFAQARMVLECRKLYADFLRPENFILSDVGTKNYPKKDFHKFFIGEIENCYIKRDKTTRSSFSSTAGLK